MRGEESWGRGAHHLTVLNRTRDTIHFDIPRLYLPDRQLACSHSAYVSPAR